MLQHPGPPPVLEPVPPPPSSSLPTKIKEVLRSLTVLYQHPGAANAQTQDDTCTTATVPSRETPSIINSIICSDDCSRLTHNDLVKSISLSSGSLSDVAVCTAYDALELQRTFQQLVDSKVDWLSKAACCLRSMKDTLEHVERELMDMESCCRTALDQAETLNVVYTDAAEEEQAVRRFIEIVKQKIYYFDKLETLREEVGSNAKLLIARLLTEDFRSSTQEKSLETTAESSSVTQATLCRMFGVIDDALSFFTLHQEFAESSSYASLYTSLRQELLLGIRQVIQQTLEACEAQALRQRAIQPSLKIRFSKRHPIDQFLAGFRYTALHERFRSAGNNVKPLLAVLQLRSSRNANSVYAETLALLEGVYTSTRLRLLMDPVRERLTVLSRKYLEEEERLTRDDLHTTSNGSDASEKKQENYDAFLGTTRLSYVVRQGVTFCVSVGQLESDTFHSFFPQQETSQEGTGLCTMLRTIGDTFVRLFRPLILHSTQLPELRAVSDALTMDFSLEAEGNGFSSASSVEKEHLAPLYYAVLRLHKDVEERMIFKTELFIGEKIRGFEPQFSDLDYPAVLFTSRQLPSFPFAIESSSLFELPNPLPSPGSAATTLEPKRGILEEAASWAEDTLSSETQNCVVEISTDDGWYPSLRSFMLCLAALEGVIKPTTFQNLGQRATESCFTSLLDAAERIKLAKGSVHDASLFLIKHLLMLREQTLHYFQYDLVVTENVLDFTSMRSRIGSVLRRSITKASHMSQGAEKELAEDRDALTLKEVLGTFVPAIQETKSSTQRNLEVALKTHCEALVAHFGVFLLLPLLRLSSLCGEMERRNKGSGQVASSTEPDGDVAVSAAQSKKQIDGISTTLLRQHLTIFRRKLIFFVPRILFNFNIYLAPMAVPDKDKLCLPLLQFPVHDIRSEPSECVRNDDTQASNAVPSAAAILSKVLKDAVIDSVRHLERIFIDFPYYTSETQTPDGTCRSFSNISLDALKTQFLWWTDEEVASRWEWLSTRYEHALAELA